MSKIIELWNKEELPIKNGVYFSDGKSISLSIIAYPSILIEKGKEFDLDDFLVKNPDEVTSIDIMKRFNLSEEYQCILGEGSYGSEGFVAYLTSKDDLLWVMYFEKSNPFVNLIKLPNLNIEVESSANYKIIINVNDPSNIILSP